MIKLVETRRNCSMFETTPRYDIFLHNELFGQLYFNTKGYVGSLPAPHPERTGKAISLNIGEKPISTYKQEVAKLNKEWDQLWYDLTGFKTRSKRQS